MKVTKSWHWCVLCHNFPRKLSPRLQLYSYNSNLFFCPSNLILYELNWLRTTAETPFHRTLLWLCFVSFTFFVWSDAPELVLPQSFNGSLRRCFEQMGFYYSLSALLVTYTLSLFPYNNYNSKVGHLLYSSILNNSLETLPWKRS